MGDFNQRTHVQTPLMANKNLNAKCVTLTADFLVWLFIRLWTNWQNRKLKALKGTVTTCYELYWNIVNYISTVIYLWDQNSNTLIFLSHRCFHLCCLIKPLLRTVYNLAFPDICFTLLLVLMHLLGWDSIPCYHSYWSIEFCGITLFQMLLYQLKPLAPLVELC